MYHITSNNSRISFKKIKKFKIIPFIIRRTVFNKEHFPKFHSHRGVVKK
jgi:hypothetical protein